MASSSPITLSSTTTIMEERYHIFLPRRSVNYPKRPPKRHARFTHADVLVLNEAANFLKVAALADVIRDWRYGGMRTRNQIRAAKAQGGNTHGQFRTQSPRSPPPKAITAPFTDYFGSGRHERTRYADAPEHEVLLASPCERISCKRQSQELDKQWVDKRLRLTMPRPPQSLRLTMLRAPLTSRSPADFVARGKATELLAQGVLRVLSTWEAQVSTNPPATTSVEPTPMRYLGIVLNPT